MTLEDVKELNQRYIGLKEQCDTIKKEYDFAQRSLEDKCETLSETLGIKVTSDNLEEIYKAKLEECEKTYQETVAILDDVQAELNKNND